MRNSRNRSSLCRPQTSWAVCKTSTGAWVDRKSTRLNSSHPNISYAVFCLKKKIVPALLEFRFPEQAHLVRALQQLGQRAAILEVAIFEQQDLIGAIQAANRWSERTDSGTR